MRLHGSGDELWVCDTKTKLAERIAGIHGLVEDAQWSPDSKLLAFYSDADGYARVWLWDRTTRSLRRIAEAKAQPMTVSTLRWNPDGNAVAVLLQPEGSDGATRESHKLAQASPTNHTTAVIFKSRKSPVGNRDQEDQEGTSSGSDDKKEYRLQGQYPADVALIKIHNGEVRRIIVNRYVSWYDFSPDGRWIALSYETGIERDTGRGLFTFLVADITNDEPQIEEQEIGSSWGFAAWSPDSQTLAFVSIDRTVLRGSIRLLSTAARRSSTAAELNLSGQESWDPWYPLWSPDGKSIFVTAAKRLWMVHLEPNTLIALTPEKWDREVVTIVSNNKANQVWCRGLAQSVTIATNSKDTIENGYYRIDTKSQKLTKIREERRSYGSDRSPPLTSEDGSTLVYISEDEQHPPDLWVAHEDLSNVEQLTDLNPSITDASLGTSRIIHYLGLRGEPLRAALMVPSGYIPSKRYPLVVLVYPGPYKRSEQAHIFDLDQSTGINAQLFATRGYAVLVPEVPLYAPGMQMKDMARGVDNAVSKTIELGIVDPARLAIMGHSSGGFATLATICLTNRFKAAVVYAGFGDLIGQYLTFHPETGSDEANWEKTSAGMGGSPWEYRDRYVENSPIMYLDKIVTPVLLIHGSNDQKVAVEMADQVFVGLRRLGKEVEYHRYSGEAHSLAGTDNLIDYWESTIKWVERYCK